MSELPTKTAALTSSAAEHRRQDADGDALQGALAALGAVLLGKDPQLELAVACLVARGHLLLEDVPGTGKTTLGRALAAVFGLDFKRVQFTADLLPSDLIGLGIPNVRGELAFRPGPLFAQVVLADELNRTPPRTQSALLEAMSEGHISVDGVRHQLPDPFLVIATQNPADFEGTYPLPESQLDRFLVRTRLGYPTPASERALLRSRRGTSPVTEVRCVGRGPLLAAMAAVQSVRVDSRIEDDLLAIVRLTRESRAFDLGASPRAALDLDRFARALAVVDGRSYCVPDDVRRAAVPVLAHRLVPSERLMLEFGGPDPVEALLQSELAGLALPD